MKAEDVKHFTVDKSEWGNGPWQFEPDRFDFTHAGLPCLLHRGPQHYGHWCGYVGVSSSHPLYGKCYSDDAVNVDVHGGLTYAHACDGEICHVPKPGEPDEVWWFGFDCAHSGDLSPAYHARYMSKGYPFDSEPYDHARATLAKRFDVDVYRTLEYVKAETEKLAEQLAGMKS